jgi:hypothetical protein
MSRRASVVLSCFALALAAVSGAQGAARDYPTIDVTFNSNNTISMSLNGSSLNTSAASPASITPGTYNFSFTNPTYVSDIQYHLEGPGVKLITNMSYGEEPSEVWVETFAPGSTYTWKDDLNPNPVFTFVTTNAGSVGSANSGSAGSSSGKSIAPISSGTNGKATSTDVVGSAIAPFRGTLTASVSATGVVTLKLGGKLVQNLKSGKYTLAITDASKKAGFNLQQIKNSPMVLTTTGFTGTRKKTLTFKAGQWFYYPTFVGKKTYFIVTS